MVTKNISQLTDQLLQDMGHLKTAKKSETEKVASVEEKITPKFKVKIAEDLREAANVLRDHKVDSISYDDVSSYVQRIKNA